MAAEAYVFDAYGTLYDVQSVSQVIREKFPRHGELITQVWRLKQLEYTWLHSLMNNYRSFWDITKDSLTYTLEAVGVQSDAAIRAEIMGSYLRLDPHPDCHSALDALAGMPLAILSNGDQEMLDRLVENTGLDRKLHATISIDKGGIFKPSGAAYELVEKRLNVKPENVIFVSSNAFDACAARNFGFRVAWIERVTQTAMNAEVDMAEVVGPSTMFKLLRMQMEHLGMEPDYRLTSLNDLAALRRPPI